MFESLNRARNWCLINPYEFCKEFMELSGKEEQEKLIKFLCSLNDSYSMSLWKIETESDIKELKHDCADVLSETGNIKIYTILSSLCENYIFIDYEDEHIVATDDLLSIVDYIDDIEIFKNLEREERISIFLWVAENYIL